MRGLSRRFTLQLCGVLALALGALWPARRLASQEPAVVRSLLDSLATHSAAESRQLWTTVRRVYAARGFAALWLSSGAWTDNSRAWQQELKRAEEDGLEASDYPIPSLDRQDAGALARADARFSLSVIRYVQDLGWGVTAPGPAQRSTYFVRRPFMADSVLSRATTAPTVALALHTMAPSTLGYTVLRDALARLRRQQVSAEWSQPSTGSTLRRGDTNARVRELRALLAERGDLAVSGTLPDGALADVFDETVAGAVARFQSRHGLLADSIYGADTRKEMAVSVAKRIEQVTLGMERMRWMPPTPAGRWIAVNLADYHVFVFDDSLPVFTSRVVVGSTNHQTPMFIDTLTNVVINPWWNVPPSIERAEIRPAIRRDPNYLSKNHMIRVDGGIRQLPGPWNALGQIAFMFPNAFNVYMHDTPAKALFALPERAHSHGCIRVAQPHGLAQLLLSAQGVDPARIDSIIASGERTVIPLAKGIPVWISYATAFPGTDGQLQFRRDVYGRDATLRQAVARYRRHTSDFQVTH